MGTRVASANKLLSLLVHAPGGGGTGALVGATAAGRAGVGDGVAVGDGVGDGVAFGAGVAVANGERLGVAVGSPRHRVRA